MCEFFFFVINDILYKRNYNITNITYVKLLVVPAPNF